MRIIRVSGCHDCDYPEEHPHLPGLYCEHPKVISKKLIYVTNCIKNKKVHNDCPLEEVEGVISHSPIMKRAKSSKPYFKPIRRIYHLGGRGKRSVY